MALPNTRKDNKPDETASVSETASTGVIFEEPVEGMPGAAAINAVVNPFQEAVNKLAADPRGHAGNALPVVVDKKAEATTRTLIRRAANNIDKGARTKSVDIKDGPHKGMVRVYFTIGEKIEKTRSES